MSVFYLCLTGLVKILGWWGKKCGEKGGCWLGVILGISNLVLQSKIFLSLRDVEEEMSVTL